MTEKLVLQRLVGPIALNGLFSVAARLSLRLRRLESLCHHFVATF